MVGGELPAARRRARLVQHRRALRRRLGQVDRVKLVVRPVVPHAMNPVRIGKDPALPVAQHGAVLPASLPQLVDHLHVVLGHGIARVVAGLLALAHALRGAVQVAGDDVPADAPVGQMVQRRHAAGERIGRLERQRAGDAEAQVLRHQRHRRDQQQRVVHRHLHRLFQRGARAAAIHVVDAQHVGEKQRVKPPALQCAREIGPVAQRVVGVGAVARMCPQAGRLVCHAVHVEGVQADLLGHLGGLGQSGHVEQEGQLTTDARGRKHAPEPSAGCPLRPERSDSPQASAARRDQKGTSSP